MVGFLGFTERFEGISAALEASVDGHALDGGCLVVLCGGVAAFLVGCSICHRVLPNRSGNAVVGARIDADAVLVALALVVTAASPAHLVGAIALLSLGLIVFDARSSASGESGRGDET